MPRLTPLPAERATVAISRLYSRWLSSTGLDSESLSLLDWIEVQLELFKHHSGTIADCREII